MKNFIVLYLLAICPALAVAAEKRPQELAKAAHDNVRTLAMIGQTKIKEMAAQAFILPVKCDSEVNVYLETGIAPSDGIWKFSSKGKLLARFQANSASDLPVDAAHYYSVGLTGEVYQIADPHENTRAAVLIFGKDGRYESGVLLETPLAAKDWMPSQVAAFSSGQLLVTGLVLDNVKRISTPFTAIFSSSGQLLKQIILADDKDIEKKVEGGDPQVVRVDHPYSNSAVEFGQMDTARDGNIYLLRNLFPALVYAISPGGEVVKRFTVDTGGPTLSMSVAGSKIAFHYQEGDAGRSAIKITDLEGHVQAVYRLATADGRDEFGSALACFTEDPERFTFLGTSEDGFLEFRIAEPR